jgi:hypothetical protein
MIKTQKIWFKCGIWKYSELIHDDIHFLPWIAFGKRKMGAVWKTDYQLTAGWLIWYFNITW